MTCFSIRPRLSMFIIVSTLMSTLILTLPFAAWALGDKPMAKSEHEKQYQPVSAEKIEKHISHLHDQLEITPPQDATWNAFAQVMRDNSTRMNALLEKWSQNRNQMTALDNLKAHGEMADEHSQGLSKLIPVFATLYNSMSEEQKKGADIAFSQHKSKELHGNKKP